MNARVKLSLSELAYLCEVSPTTIKLWLDAGIKFEKNFHRLEILCDAIELLNGDYTVKPSDLRRQINGVSLLSAIKGEQSIDDLLTSLHDILTREAAQQLKLKSAMASYPRPKIDIDEWENPPLREDY